jgi:hypothetical protein
MIYAVGFFCLCVGVSMGFVLCAIMTVASDADDQTEQFLRSRDFK